MSDDEYDFANDDEIGGDDEYGDDMIDHMQSDGYELLGADGGAGAGLDETGDAIGNTNAGIGEDDGIGGAGDDDGTGGDGGDDAVAYDVDVEGIGSGDADDVDVASRIGDDRSAPGNENEQQDTFSGNYDKGENDDEDNGDANDDDDDGGGGAKRRGADEDDDDDGGDEEGDESIEKDSSVRAAAAAAIAARVAAYERAANVDEVLDLIDDQLISLHMTNDATAANRNVSSNGRVPSAAVVGGVNQNAPRQQPQPSIPGALASLPLPPPTPQTQEALYAQLSESFDSVQAEYRQAKCRLSDSYDFEKRLDDLVSLASSAQNKPDLPSYLHEPRIVQRTTMRADVYQLHVRGPMCRVMNDDTQKSNTADSSTAASTASTTAASTTPTTARSIRVDETTVQAPHCTFLPSRLAADNIIHNQFTVQATTSFYQWRAFCTIHERMKLRRYVLVRGYPPMDLNAFARTFWIPPSATVNPRPVAWINRCKHTVFGRDVDENRSSSSSSSSSSSNSTMDVAPVPMPRDQMYLPLERRDAYTVAMMYAVIDAAAIQAKLAMYFVHETLIATTDGQRAKEHCAPAFESYASPSSYSSPSSSSDSTDTAADHHHPTAMPLRLSLTTQTSDTVHVCFLPAEDTRIITKHLMFERAHNALLPVHMHRADDERTLRPQNKPLPIDELFLVVDKEPNAAFRVKVEAMHTADMPVDLRCIYDVWAQSSLWINPMKVQMVDRMEIAREYPRSVQRLLDANQTALAIQHAHTYRKMDVNDIPVRFMGARPGNFVRAWKTATKNSAPTLYIVVRIQK